MNNIREIQRINAAELAKGIDSGRGSWHDEYKDSAYIYVGGLSQELTEGDVICVFSQYGEIVDCNLVRDKTTGKSKGFAFLAYEDQRSTVLAVDNFNGTKLVGRTLRVDHVKDYKPPKAKEGEEEEERPRVAPMGILPGDQVQEEEAIHVDMSGLDPEDPMYEMMLEERRKKARKEAKRQAKRERKEKKETTHGLTYKRKKSSSPR